ncbi:type II toxin-antitoxin system VapC family toxin [Desulfonatronum thioautotrophicum]|uniref:type II toxin-antitoxin system VapC family toxin n=1 Tax=Desulfonatronum thioautotrophicum TaxID=617001 RepID=UPI0005EAD9F6|nr:PIN domain-containing protein [Desulfonatronum thioautotrophicum]
MPNIILVDAGPLIALFDKDDRYHLKMKEFVRNGKFKFVTTTAVMTEVSHMLDFSAAAQIHFLEWVMREGVILHEIAQGDIARILELTLKYKDLPMYFADATLVVAAERSGIRTIISIDSDFDVYRLPGKERIANIFAKKRLH